MKPETKVWLKLDNVGRPANRVIIQCTNREAVMTIAEWLMGIYMGQKIRITLARTEEELSESKRSESIESMVGDLQALLDKPPETQTT